MTTDLGATARRLGRLVEPLAAGIYFAPEAQERYEALGLDYVQGYFCSRSACFGVVPWRVVQAAFAAFSPALVESSVTAGWAKTTPEQLLDARLAGAREQLGRLLGEPAPAEVSRATELLLDAVDGVDGSGRVLFSGLRGLELPGADDPLGRLWRAADLVREHRGDGHIAAWVPHLDSCEITVVTELWWGIEPGSYVWTRGYRSAEVAAARVRLAERGVLDGEGADAALTPAGRALRDDVEEATDRAALAPVRRLGDRVDELVTLLEPWAAAMTGVPGGYPASTGQIFG
jgi:hypothetical protein